MKNVFATGSAIQTQKISANLARKLSAAKPGFTARVVGLSGELGSGKTVFARGFAKGLGIKDNIVSPTFVLERIYELPGKRHRHFIHIDAYRVEKPRELLDLGFKNLIRDPTNIILVEWAEKIKSIFPKNYIEVKFEHMGGNKRKITINSKFKMQNE